MKLLLCKNIPKLGIVGDIVDVKAGYARNYLVPRRLATEPTDTNIRALADARRIAEEERIRERELLAKLAERLEGVEVTVPARANEDGVLYGSVGRREIAAALVEDGYPIEADQVALGTPLRHLDNLNVAVKLADGIEAEIKVWIVREKTGSDDGEAGASKESGVGTEADSNGDGTGE